MKTRAIPDTFAIADRLRPVLLKLGRELRREAAGEGVSPGQFVLLAAIKQEPGIGIRELAALERMSAPGMSQAIDRLERAGLVARTQHQQDRRRVGLTLTDEGQRVLRRVRSRRTAWLGLRLGRLSPGELEAIEAALEPLALLLDEEERP